MQMVGGAREGESQISVTSIRRTGLISASSRPKHEDPKTMFEGLDGASVQAGLNHVKQLTVLLQRSPGAANVRDADGDRRPLHWAAARGHVRCVQLLLRAGADTRALDVNGCTAADLARKYGKEEARMAIDAWLLDNSVDSASSYASSAAPSSALPPSDV